MRIKAVIFDMDGVLIDAKDWHYDALNRALAVYGHSISREDHLDRFDGLPTRKKLEVLSAERDLDPNLHQTINDLKQKFTLEIANERLLPNLKHKYALSRLKNEGFRVGLASNSIRASIELMMRLSHLDTYLDFLLSNQDVSEGKPSPEIYLKAIDCACVLPTETLVVEDNQFGIQAAKGAGAHVLEVGGVEDVLYENIRARIDSIESDAIRSTTVRRAA